MRWKRNYSLWDIALYSGINVLFILKYGLRIAPVCTTIGACALYIVVIAGVIWSIDLLVKKLNNHIIFLLMSIVVVGLVMLQLHFDPYTLQVDRWSAIHNFLHNLLNGTYPYAAQTHLGGYGSPFPVWQVMHLPFYLIGNVGLSFIVCLLLFIDAIRRLYGQHASLIALTLLLLSPAFIYEVCVRSDLMSNFLFCAAIIMYLCYFKVEFKRNWIALALISGLMLSTRISTIIPIAIYYFKDFCKGNIKQQAGFLILTTLVFALTFLPFLLWNGNMLLFFEYNPFMLQTRQGHISDLPLLLTIGIWASLWWKGNWHRYMLSAAGCLLILVAVTFIHNMYDDSSWNQLFCSHYDITYFNMAMPFIIAALASKEETAA